MFKNNLEALVLGALRDGPKHGYAIAKAIEKAGQGALRMGENQLYPTLHKLERDGFVAAEWHPQEGRPPRKVYALTEAGTEELARHRERWAAFASGVSSLLGAEVGHA